MNHDEPHVNTTVSFRPRYLFSPELRCRPTEGGYINVSFCRTEEGRFSSGRIVGFGEPTSGAEIVEIPDSVIIPGLVNAHTHLELSGLKQPIGARGIGFNDWIRRVIAARFSPDYDADDAMARGIELCRNCGTVLAADITQPGMQLSGGVKHAVADTGAIDLLPLYEMLGRSPQRVEELSRQIQTILDECIEQRSPGDAVGVVHCGLSPHAPYSTSLDMVDRAIGLAQQYGLAVAMHLAESPEEIRFLRDGDGPLFDLLRELEGDAPKPFSKGKRPLDYLQLLSRAPRSVVIHGNYLDDDEIDFIAHHRDRMSVVYCPRSNAHFGFGLPPLQQLIESGINVAIGTDSLASSPGLDILGELRTAEAAFPDIASSKLLAMATLDGAEAFGLRDRYAIRPGNRAMLTVIDLQDGYLSCSGNIACDTDVESLARAIIHGENARPLTDCLK